MTGLAAGKGSRGAAVLIQDLTKNYGTFRAVDGVSIAVEPGEFLALLGPSGSGKTTILMTIAGFEMPTSGEIIIGGRSVTFVPPNKRQIGMVFQKYALFPHMSVAENVAFPLKMRGIAAPERATRVEVALELVQLPRMGERRTHELSGGQQQRVALARAIVYDPPVLLMDEPLGALDKKLREQMQLEIKHIQAQLGTTVIYVTHDQGEALTMADRIAVIDHGHLQQLGPPGRLYEHPSNAFVADFIGKTNFLRGTVTSAEGLHCAVTIAPDLRIKATLVVDGGGAVRSGAGVSVAIRPERMTLRPAGDGTDGHAAVVDEIIYGGDSVTFIVRLASGDPLAVRVPSDGQAPRWRSGDEVTVSWKPEDARVFPSEPVEA